jgi:hypothetical protein
MRKLGNSEIWNGRKEARLKVSATLARKTGGL